MKTTLITTIGLVFCALIYGQQVDNNFTKHDLIKKHSNEIFDSLVKIRRDLHMNPEISGQEQRTSKIIEEYLLRLGLEVKTNIGGYGVVGILKGNKEGRKIAWRADIDALETDLPDLVDFKSKNEGIRHICGHDIHTVIGLGIANVLANQKNNIAGTIYFIFQPSEENFEGAKSMIDDGLLNIISPDEIYCIHMFPTSIGMISTKPQEVFPYIRKIGITFHNGVEIDDIKQLTKSIAQELFRAKSESKPWEPQNVFNPDIGIGNPNNIYQDYLIINEDFNIVKQDDDISFETYLSETNRTNLDSILKKVKQKILTTKYRNQLVSVEYATENPTVVNDSGLTEKALEIITRIYGNETVFPIYGQIPFFNDDFAYFQQHVKGVYFFMGGSNFEKGLISVPHSSDFAVDEDCIKIGVKYFSSLIIERTNMK